MTERPVLAPRRSSTRAVEESEQSASKRLFVRLYEELLAAAQDRLRREPADHTLQPAAVVHEAYLRLSDRDSLSEDERTRFLALAGRTMHQVLVDHARRRRSEKRGAQWRRITLSDCIDIAGRGEIDVLALDEALSRLTLIHERAARIVELRFFAGLEESDVARELGVSRTTIQSEWRLARAWLHKELGE